jgi:hypothetical protein
MVKKTHPHARAYNTQIRRLYLELEDHFLQGGTFDTYGLEAEQKSIIAYCEQVIQKSEAGLLPLTEGTLKSYRATLRRRRASSKIYLTTDEIARLEQLDLSARPTLERERDRFLLAYYFVMRFSDVVRIRREWLFRLNNKV